MDNIFLRGNDLELHEAFGIILSIESFSDYVNEIAELVYNNSLEKRSLGEVLTKYKINQIEDINEEILDLLIVYINLILKDHIITEREIQNIKYLKLVFNIQEGDFYTHRYEEIDEILSKQFYRMYRDDDRIDETEALHKVSLQKLFDLSYDQFLEFQEGEIIAALERGAKITELDTVYKISQDFITASDKISRRISQKVKDLVWNRDGGKCVNCNSKFNLEFDHIIPFSKGGSNTYRNIQLLCEKCNRQKKNKIG